ncbi:hypothetical protein [Salinigranum rubrum]|uniref:hypothetical protein n=1 Tax=Salinigranum rubrum TaxID=755307 RepID=UPI0013A5BC0C|nr:hypothetical protein [Salinigranum rubrum]
MQLSPEQKRTLAATYEPILVLHPREKFTPVNPRVYMESCAMWCTEPGSGDAIHAKDNWGDCSGQQSFPRKPLIERSNLSTDPSDSGPSDPVYIGERDDLNRPQYLTSGDERLLWLDTTGWKRDTDEWIVPPWTTDVTEETANREVSIDAARDQYQSWREETEDGTRPVVDWYSAEVVDLDELEELLVRSSDAVSLENLKTLFSGSVLVVWYYFLYPVHQEETRGCERVAGVGRHGNYEGDWTAVGVVVHREGWLSLLEDIAEDGDLDVDHDRIPEPLYVGFGRRGKGVLESLDIDVAKRTFRPRMEVDRWQEVGRRAGTHPVVYVARGSHNNYRTAGEKSPPSSDLSDTTCEAVEGAAKVASEVNKKADETVEVAEEVADDARDAAVTLAKVAAGAGAGAAIAGGAGAALGAGVGAVSAGIEASQSSVDLDGDGNGDGDGGVLGGGSGVDAGDATDQTAAEDDYGVVLAPEHLVSQLQSEFTATDVRPWTGEVSDRIVDRREQRWWPTTPEVTDDEGRPIQGYDGRWGALCRTDPADRRSGIEFPLFKRSLLKELVMEGARE